MWVYQVWGMVGDSFVNVTTVARDGREALHNVVRTIRPNVTRGGRDWQERMRRWWRESVRLNVTQVSGPDCPVGG